MANEIQVFCDTGQTLYAVLLNSAGQIWNGFTFGAINGANWTDYDIVLTEAAAGIYLGSMPGAVAGNYTMVAYERAGASPAVSDAQRYSGWLSWDGAAEIGMLSSAAAQVAAAAALTAYDPATNAEMEARTLVAASYATASALAAVDDFLDTEVAAILADTNELQTDWVNGGRLDLILDAIAADATVLVGGAGAIAAALTVTDSDGNPLDGVEVWITTDVAGTLTVASGVTDSLGVVTFYLDAGTYYAWLQYGGYNPPVPPYTVLTVTA